MSATLEKSRRLILSPDDHLAQPVAEQGGKRGADWPSHYSTRKCTAPKLDRAVLARRILGRT